MTYTEELKEKLIAYRNEVADSLLGMTTVEASNHLNELHESITGVSAYNFFQRQMVLDMYSKVLDFETEQEKKREQMEHTHNYISLVPNPLEKILHYA